MQSGERWAGQGPGSARGEPGKVGLVYVLGVSLWMGLGEVREPGQVGCGYY